MPSASPISTAAHTDSTAAGRLATIAPIRSERVRCSWEGGFGWLGQNSRIPKRLMIAGASVSAASSISATPTISPGASVRSDSRLATSSAANAAMTVAAAEAITTPTRLTAVSSAFSAGSPLATCSRWRNSRKTM